MPQTLFTGKKNIAQTEIYELINLYELINSAHCNENVPKKHILRE